MRKLIIFLTLLLMPINSTAALDPEQRRAIDAVKFFNVERDCVIGAPADENDTPCVCKVGVSTTLSGDDNMEIIYNYMTGTKGLTREQASGFMGNIQHESTFNPKAVEDGEWGGRQWGGDSDTIPPPVGREGQPGYGLVQWTSPERKQGLQKMSDSDSQKRPVYDIGLQLDFMWSELESAYYKPRALDPLRAAKDVPTATKIIQQNYEVGTNYEARLRNAERIYKIFKDKAPSTGVPASTQPSGSCSSISGPGQDSKYVDGFLVYSQYDPAWKDKPYASSTIGESGCGPSAMAMIITALTGGSVKPPETADYAAKQGLYVPGAGSKWTIGPVLAKNWGLKSQFIGADVAKISATLQAGGLVIAAGQGAKPFTSGGHIIVIRAVTSDGKFKIGDSGHSDTSDQLWDARQLVGSMADGSVYAITK